MAKKSETLRQREKAQKDLLELKKMQKGELDPSTLKKDEKIVPRTFGEKVSHFFFYYKYVLLGCTALFVALAIILGSCIAKPNYDAKITVFCSEYVSEDVITAMNEWLTSYYPDVNENGEVELLFADCSFSVETDQKSYSDNMLLKVQSLLASEKDAMLFILDEDNLKYLNGISKDFVLFSSVNMVELPQSFYDSLPANRNTFKDNKTRYLCLRTIAGTSIEGEKAKANYNAAKEVIKTLRAEYPVNDEEPEMLEENITE